MGTRGRFVGPFRTVKMAASGGNMKMYAKEMYSPSAPIGVGRNSIVTAAFNETGRQSPPFKPLGSRCAMNKGQMAMYSTSNAAYGTGQELVTSNKFDTDGDGDVDAQDIL